MNLIVCEDEVILSSGKQQYQKPLPHEDQCSRCEVPPLPEPISGVRRCDQTSDPFQAPENLDALEEIRAVVEARCWVIVGGC
jgi:hypothetical protein